MNIQIKNTLPDKATKNDVINILLRNRGITSGEIDPFLSPPHPTTYNLKDFGFSEKYIDSALETIWACHPKNPKNKTPEKPIIVYTDYDADGVTGGTVLWETLHLLGFTVFPYIPNRITEGYGFSKLGLDTVKEKYDPALIISVDHGIVADTQVTYAVHELGIPMIITDHHNRQEDKVPKLAKAIFHIPVLSGSGTAYYVAKEIAVNVKVQMLALSEVEGSNSNELLLEKLFQLDYIGIAAIGTVADLVPLQGQSRSMVFHGLKVLTTTQREGIRALKQVSGHVGKAVSTYEVGFLFAPRINASGRLDDALDSLRLLCTHDLTKATQLAQKLNRLNIERQDMVKQAVDEAVSIVESMKDESGILPKILIVSQKCVIARKPALCHLEPVERRSNEAISSDSPQSPSTYWHEGIIGLIASKLCDKYYRPTIVLTHTQSTPSTPLRYLSGVPPPVGREGTLASTEKLSPSILDVSVGIPLPNGKDSIGDPSLGREGHNVAGGVLKASCRSIPGFHMTEFLAFHKDILMRFGGHEAAAGFSVETSKLELFTQRAVTYAHSHITDNTLDRLISVDCELPIDMVDIKLAESIEKLAPFGMGNPRPTFVSRGKIGNVSLMGKDRQHARLSLIGAISPHGHPVEKRDPKIESPHTDVNQIEMVAFGKATEIQALDAKSCEIVYSLDINRWNGSEKVQGKYIAVK